MAKIISRIETISLITLVHKFTQKKNHFVIPMKQNFEILFYISTKMPMTHLKLILFNGWIYRIFNSFINNFKKFRHC
jgi:hypothetical protein